MKTLSVLSLIIVGLITTGCLGGSKYTKEILNALSKDNATLHVKVTNPLYGTLEATRLNPSSTNTMPHSIDPNGSIKAGNVVVDNK